MIQPCAAWLPPAPVVAKQPHVLNMVYFRLHIAMVSVDLDDVEAEIAVPATLHKPACACAKDVPLLLPIDRPKATCPFGMPTMRLHLHEHNASAIRRKRDNVQFAPPVLCAWAQIPPDNAPTKPCQVCRRDILAPPATRHTSVWRLWQPMRRPNLTLHLQPPKARHHIHRLTSAMISAASGHPAANASPAPQTARSTRHTRSRIPTTSTARYQTTPPGSRPRSRTQSASPRHSPPQCC